MRRCIKKERLYTCLCIVLIVTVMSIIYLSIGYNIQGLIADRSISTILFDRGNFQKSDKEMLVIYKEYSGILSCLKQTQSNGTLRWKHPGKLTKWRSINKIAKEWPSKPKYLHLPSKNNTHTIPISETRYITIKKQKGRLGNQMFQLAVLLGLANLTGHVPFLHHRFSKLDDVFDLPSTIYKTVDTTSFKTYIQKGSITSNDFDKVNLTYNWIIDGYFQSFKHLNHIRDALRDMFQFKTYFKKFSKDFIASNVPKERVLVGIHVRRGDYINSHERLIGRLTPPLDYYNQAMEFYRCLYRNVTFIVVSDDKRWCRMNFKSPDTIISRHNHPGADLALMSMCDHTIMSVGTFGWWGGWLAGGHVVYYGQPHEPGSKLDNVFSVKEFYPPTWIGLS